MKSPIRAASRRCTPKILAWSVWPAEDRRAWENACTEGDPFGAQGAAAHWSTGTRRAVGYGYGRWLGWLQSELPDILSLPPAERVTSERVAAFIAHLKSRITPAGTHNYVKHAYDAIRVMAPDQDWSWLRDAAWHLARDVHPRDKRGRIVDCRRLFQLGLDLMSDAKVPTNTTLVELLRYRDGLIIALLSVLPVRRRNLTSIRVGTNLMPVGDSYYLAFGAHETKARRALEHEVPSALAPWIRRYLADVRPKLPGAEYHDGLWPSAKGGPLCAEAIYDLVCRRTKAAFGLTINPHLFRDALVTTIALEAPDQIGRARELLGHQSLDVLERHYNQANSINASRLYSEIVADVRDKKRRRGGLHANAATDD